MTTYFSLSPSHFERRSEADAERKVEFPASVATALARYDFPVPGGPYSRIPLQGFLFPETCPVSCMHLVAPGDSCARPVSDNHIFQLCIARNLPPLLVVCADVTVLSRLVQRFAWLPWKRCGNLMGRMTASLRASFAAWSPATSSHLMFGFSTTTTPEEN